MVVTEDVGRRIELQSFEETKAEIDKILKGVYGKNVPAPTGKEKQHRFIISMLWSLAYGKLAMSWLRSAQRLFQGSLCELAMPWLRSAPEVVSRFTLWVSHALT